MIPFAFFRDDDVGYSNNIFMELTSYFISRGIPLNAAVIPSEIRCLDEDVMELLRNPNICILQHGFNHELNYVSGHVRGEFGGLENGIDDEERLNRGWNLLNTAFNSPFKGFVPPWHTFPNMEYLLKNEYRLISGYGIAMRQIRGMISLPVNIDLIEDYDTGKHYCFDRMMRMVETSMRQSGFLGFLLHHNYMSPGDIEYIGKIIDFLYLNKIGIIRMDAVLK